MKRFGILMSLAVLVALSACSSGVTTASGSAYPVTGRTAGHDDSSMSTSAVGSMNKSLRK